MKKAELIGLAAACAAVVSIDASEIVLPVGTTTNVAIATDATLDSSVTLADRTVFEKTGAGTWTLPSGQFTQDKTVNLRVREGGVALRKTEQLVSAYAQPLEVMNRAAFWLESRTNLVKDGDDIRMWRDVRDTDGTATNHYYAVTDNTWTDVCPQEATYLDKAAVYFGGYQSGCWMNWLAPAGTQATVGNLVNVFLVAGAQTSWGYLLGQRRGSSPFFQCAGSGDADKAIWINHNAENQPMHASRTYRDGTEIDPFTTTNGVGMIRVLEVECLGTPQSAQCFFNDRDFWKDGNGFNPMFGETSTTQTAGGKRSGGEYVFEVLLFTNRLTEVERVAVANWLLAKWKDVMPPAGMSAKVSLATNTTVRMAGDDGMSVDVDGDGAIVKDGDGTLSVRPSVNPPRLHTVKMSIEGGRINAGCVLPYAAQDGETVTSAARTWGPELSSSPSSAGAGRFVKAGDGPLLIDSIPEGVAKVSVTGGQLTLADPDAKADFVRGPDLDIAADIPEWNFETYNATSVSDAYQYIRNTEYQGWHGIRPDGDGRNDVFIFDNTFGSKTSWVLNEDTPTGSGHGSLVIKCDSSAWCAFSVPETGSYVLRFWAAPRRSANYIGRHVDVVIATEEDEPLATWYFAVTADKWRQFAFDALELEAGKTYRLWFKSLGLGIDYCTQFDEIKLAIPEEETGCWTIPNGDFEDHADNFTSTFTLDNTNRVAGFTVEQCTSIGTATASNEQKTHNNSWTTFSVNGSDNWAHYNLPWSKGGDTQFYMSGAGSKLATTFTPPAGKWMLQADMSVWCVTASSGWTYGIDASVEIGGETVSLGRYSTGSHALVARRWPNAFVSDGSTPVTLTLTGVLTSSACGHGIVDNLKLVKATGNDTNLLANPGLDGISGWTFRTTPKPSGVTGSGQYPWNDSLYVNYFGLEPNEGTGCFKLVNDDWIYQSVNFATGGLYRLTVNLKARGTTSVNVNNGCNPINVYVAKDGVTNWVGQSDAAATTNFNEYAFMFALPPEGGRYDVGFKGASAWTGDESAKVDRTTLMDAAWLCRVDTDKAIELPENLEIDVAAGARLRLDFTGTNHIESLRIAGRSYAGLVSVTTCPELYPVLSGPGTLEITPKGTILLIR